MPGGGGGDGGNGDGGGGGVRYVTLSSGPKLFEHAFGTEFVCVCLTVSSCFDVSSFEAKSYKFDAKCCIYIKVCLRLYQ